MKKIIVIMCLLMLNVIAYFNWDRVVKYFGEPIVGISDEANGRIYSPIKKYYIEIWDTVKFTSHINEMNEPGFVKVYDAATNKLLYESKIFDVRESGNIIWPFDPKNPYLIVGNEIIMQLPIEDQ
jgi:hypothetical protein